MQVMTLSHDLRKESKWTKIKHAIKLSAFGLAYGRAGGDDESAKDFEILFNPRAPWPAYEKATPHLSGLYVYPEIQLEFSFIRLLRRLSAQPVHEGRTFSVFYKFRNYVEFGRLVRTGHWRWLEWTYFPQAKQWIANTIENNFHNLFFPS